MFKSTEQSMYHSSCYSRYSTEEITVISSIQIDNYIVGVCLAIVVIVFIFVLLLTSAIRQVLRKGVCVAYDTIVRTTVVASLQLVQLIVADSSL